MYKSLVDIAKMMTPRPYWGSSYMLSDEDAKIWMDRMQTGGVHFSELTLTIPVHKKHKIGARWCGRGKAGEDRLEILNTLSHHYPDKGYEVIRDEQLHYIISQDDEEIIFSSNVDNERVNLIIDHHNTRRFGWASIHDEDVNISIVELTIEQFEKEKRLRCEEKERISKMAFDVVAKMHEENN